MEQRDILRHDGDRGAQALLRNARDILSVEQHTAAFHIVEPLQQRKQTGLPGAGGPDQSDALTRFEMQIEVLEQLVTSRWRNVTFSNVTLAPALTSGTASGWSRSSCGTSSVSSASVSRARCWITSTSATARSRVACSTERPSVQASTTSPVVNAPCCQSEIAQASIPIVSTMVTSAWTMRSRSRYQRLRCRAVTSRSMV